MSAIADELQRGIDAGLHFGGQAVVWRDGEVVLDVAVGEAQPGVAMRAETRMLWMSACKPITAVAVAQLYEDGEIDLDEPVAMYLPAFAQGDKQPITIRHVLTHTGGFREANLKGLDGDWHTAVERVCEAPLEHDWAIGESAGYHPQTSWFVLGALVEAVRGEAYADWVKRKILEPCGMDGTLMPIEPGAYDAAWPGMSQVYDTSRKPGVEGARETGYAAAGYCTVMRPGSNVWGPAGDLVKFYGMLLKGGEGERGRVLEPETVALFTDRHRTGKHDRTFQHVVDFGLGFLLNSRMHGPATVPYGYGDWTDERTFGHSGNQSSVGFADPTKRIAAAVICNGMPGEPRHQKRQRAWLAALGGFG